MWEPCGLTEHMVQGSWLFHKWAWGVCFTHVEADDVGRRSIQPECHDLRLGIAVDDCGHTCDRQGRTLYCSHQASLEKALATIDAFETKLWKELLHGR